MGALAFVLFAQLAAPVTRAQPVLSFPERDLDDTAAYQGYQTRFYRDAAGNTVQIYIDARADRVVHLWADAEDESIGFTARGRGGRPAALAWDGANAVVTRAGARRTLEYSLIAAEPHVDLGWFLLGSMRIERDLQYAKRQLSPFARAPFALPEFDRMIAALGALPPAERRQHLALLGAPDTQTLRARLRPTVAASMDGAVSVTRVTQSALDGRDTLVMEIRSDPRRVESRIVGDSVSLSARTGNVVRFSVRITTSGKPLTPLGRTQIFSSEFLRFFDATQADAAKAAASRATVLRARRLERQVRGLELLSSREKLMAGLPTYATYFGRDMLMTALMMRPIWRSDMSEFVIASALRKLSSSGQVSHEEALGGQAVREAASEYAASIDAFVRHTREGRAREADSALTRARAILGDMRRVRENYHMIDAEFHFPIVVARWISDPSVPAARKRAFLLDASDNGEPRLTRLLRELALVANVTADYAREPVATNLVSFAPRDSGRWASQSWRDSNVGYGGGRYAMDVNAVWAPHALESVGRILDALRGLGIVPDAAPELAADSPLGRYAVNPASLQRAVDIWRGAARHFLVQLAPNEVRVRIRARLDAMSADERRVWSDVLTRTHADADSLSFLALALDGTGRPIPVANSDVATRLFLGDHEGESRVPDGAARVEVLRDVGLFTRAYPAGLLIDGVGPVVANDAYASPSIWADFDRDRYHSPHVVWGRENNLFLLGAMRRIDDASRDPALAAYVRTLREARDRVLAAVEASGFHSELWSYEVSNGRVMPVRYGTGADVQLWSMTDLVVQFQLRRR